MTQQLNQKLEIYYKLKVTEVAFCRFIPINID